MHHTFFLSIFLVYFCCSSRAASTCDELSLLPTVSIVTSANGSIYDKIREAHWSETAWKSPSCVFRPADAKTLSDGLRIISSSNATYAIRGGGHSPFPNWANLDSGVLISLDAMNDIEYDASSETVRVGTGNRWGSVYALLSEHNRVAVGGRVFDVGFGLITGGGLSHHSGLYGFAADNVLSYEVVLSNASVITVTTTSNSDLFWALKAGGSNFGIITQVTLKTYPQEKVWGGIIIYSIDQIDKVMAAIAEYQFQGQLDPKSAILPYVAVNNFNAIFISFVYLDAVDRPAAFEPFYTIPSLSDDTKIHTNFSAAIAEVIDKVLPRWTWASTTFYLDNATYVDVAHLCQNISLSTKFQSIEGATMVLVPQPISKAMIQQSAQRGENPMNLQNREQVWFSINVGWQHESDDITIDSITTDTISQIERLTKSRSLFDRYVFYNNAHRTQDPIRSYGQNNFRKMRKISREVDGSQKFQTLVAGGFKLGGPALGLQ